MQVQKSAAKATIADSIEIEGSIFLLFVSAMFFALETLFHYESFIHEITLKNVAPEALDTYNRIGDYSRNLRLAWVFLPERPDKC